MRARTKFARFSTAQVSGDWTNRKIGRSCLYKALPTIVSTFASRASSQKGWSETISFPLLRSLCKCYPIFIRSDFVNEIPRQRKEEINIDEEGETEATETVSVDILSMEKDTSGILRDRAHNWRIKNFLRERKLFRITLRNFVRFRWVRANWFGEEKTEKKRRRRKEETKTARK